VAPGIEGGGWRSAFRALVMVALLVVVSGLLGCGGRTPIQGKVTHKGQPVTGGTLVFTPLGGSGKAATAEIKKDGTFSVGTTRAEDGAELGRYRVAFTPPPQELTEEQRKDPKYIAPPPQYMGLAPKDAEVEFKKGASVDIELVPASAPRK